MFELLRAFRSFSRRDWLKVLALIVSLPLIIFLWFFGWFLLMVGEM